MSVSANAIALAVQRRETSVSDIVGQALARCEQLNPTTNAFRVILHKSAHERALRLDNALAAGHEAGPLCGVPIAIKDNIVQRGQVATCGSKLLEHYVGSYDATAVTRLEEAGAIIVARTNMDEFGMGSSTESCAWGPVNNPWDLNRVPGGSFRGIGGCGRRRRSTHRAWL